MFLVGVNINIVNYNNRLPYWLRGKESSCNAGNAGDSGSIPGSGRCPGGGNGNPLQYCCLGNPMDRGAWWPIVRGVTKSWRGLSTHACNYTNTQELSKMSTEEWTETSTSSRALSLLRIT